MLSTYKEAKKTTPTLKAPNGKGAANMTVGNKKVTETPD